MIKLNNENNENMVITDGPKKSDPCQGIAGEILKRFAASHLTYGEAIHTLELAGQGLVEHSYVDFPEMRIKYYGEED